MRYSVAGDMFEDAYPSDCDVHLLANVLHDWNESNVRTLIARSFAALRSGGLLISYDAHLNSDKTGPLPVAEYSAFLMHSTLGHCYSVDEIKLYMSEVGFQNFSFADVACSRSVVLGYKP